MENKLDFNGLANALLSRAGDLLVSWLPGGKPVGHEYTCGDIRGGPGDSFKVNMNTGRWSDFANPEFAGGDLISLYAAIENIKNGEAAKQLSDHIGYRLSEPPAPARKKEVDHKLGKPPKNAGNPSADHPKWGKPSHSWPYHDADGSLLFFVSRYETPDGKQFCPWSWSITASRWVAKGWPAPRPLWGLERLTANPTKPILICEGEKATEAAQKLVGTAYVCVCWSNGSKAASKADWGPIHGRHVLLWSDADEAGIAAMNELSEILYPHCPQIKILDVSDRPDKWDAADALTEGWDWKQFYEWAKPRASIVVIEKKEEKPPKATNMLSTVDSPPATASLFAMWEELGLAANGAGAPYVNQDNVIRLIERHPPLKDLLWFDEFHQKYFTLWNSTKPREWEDVDDIRLTTYLQRNLGLAKMSDATVNKGCIEYAKRNIRHEPRDWMETLKWDGTSRVREFLADGFGADYNEYCESASKNFWVAMIARISQRGCKVDNMLILEGPQGKFKSTAMDIIGGKWFAEAGSAVTDKDFFLDLRGKLIMEIAELASFKRRADVEAIKRVVSCRNDRYRAPYDRSSKDHPRSSIFVATTNEHVYLFDDSGGRRFWPIGCKRVRLDWISENHEQLFAEAVHLFKSGEKWWEMPIQDTEVEQEKRRGQDEWQNIIEDYLVGRSEITTRDLAVDCLKIDVSRLDRGTQMRIAGLIRNLGWEKAHRHEDGKQGKVWTKKGAEETQGKLL